MIWLSCLGPLVLLLPNLYVIWLSNISILIQKRVVRTKFDIYIFLFICYFAHVLMFFSVKMVSIFYIQIGTLVSQQNVNKR
jgi:hypothetical protein